MKKILIPIFILCTYLALTSQETKLNQKQGTFQDKELSHIQFYKFKKFDIDLNKVAFKSISKIIIHENRVYILDSQLSRIFVFDKKARYLHSIGRPGQGPGDLQYPRDFVISEDGKIYIVCSMVKRIEVFTLDGNFIGRIELKIPEDIYYSKPTNILVTSDNKFIIGYNLSPHLLDVYDSEGKFIKNILKREDPVFVPGVNLANSSLISFVDQENSILHFNNFTGAFTHLKIDGENVQSFSAFDKLHQNEVKKLQEEYKEKSRKLMVREGGVYNFTLWSNFCMDKEGNIYAFLFWKKKEEKQKLFVFSPEGTFLYRITIPYFKDIPRVDEIYFFGDEFIFVTYNWDIYFAKKK